MQVDSVINCFRLNLPCFVSQIVIKFLKQFCYAFLEIKYNMACLFLITVTIFQWQKEISIRGNYGGENVNVYCT